MSNAPDKGKSQLAKKVPVKKVIVIAGPTASGKSALAFRLARDLKGYIVNADAMQIYADLPILSAQPSKKDMEAIPHFLYGFLPLDQACSAMNWAEQARNLIKAQEGIPILTGGTGLYLRALLDGLSPIPDIPLAIKEEGQALLLKEKAQGLSERLKKIDPLMAEKLHPNDSHRLLRAWCVIMATGRSLAEWQKVPPLPSLFEPLYFILMPKREWLYDSCNQRLLQMIEAGALEEVSAALTNYGVDRDLSTPGFKTLGFRELVAYLQEKMTLEEAIAAAQQFTRNYAKRQVTWFTHQIKQGNKISNYYDNMKLSEEKIEEIFSKIKEFY